MPVELATRFEAKIEPEPNTGCWLWVASVNACGYGTIGVHGKSVLAHRVAWTLYRGEIPVGMCVLHICDTPPCVNPAHLFLGTPRDNAVDRQKKGRGDDGSHQTRKTHCPRGHAYTRENTHIHRNKRYCRACHRDDMRLRRREGRV